MAKRQSRLSINSDTQTITFFFFTSSFENTQMRRYKNNLFSKICPMVFYHTKNKIQRHIPLCDLAPGYCLPSVTSHYTSQSLYSRLAAYLLVLEHTRHIQGTGCSLCLECSSPAYLHSELCSNITSSGKTSWPLHIMQHDLSLPSILLFFFFLK